MADILTQIQDELDMLLHQMAASLSYINTHAPPSPIVGQPLLSSFAEQEASTQSTHQPTQSTQQQQQQQTPATPPTTSPTQFRKDLKELSTDLVLKEQQIEVLIANLPGLKASARAQEERMRALQREIEALEGERAGAVRERERLLARVEERIGGVGGGAR